MEIQLTLQHIGMQLDDTKKTFYTERKEPQPDSEMMGQLVEDFRDELDKLDGQVCSLRGRAAANGGQPGNYRTGRGLSGGAT